MRDRAITTTDLTLVEQERVRNALHYLHVQFRQWKLLAKVMHFDETTLIHVANGRRSVSVLLAFRIAKIVKMPLEAVLAGKFPEPGACPRCGYRAALSTHPVART